MHRLVALVVFIALLALPAAAPAATPDRTVTVAPAFAWDGPTQMAANLSGQIFSPAICGKTPLDYCDHTLLKVDAPGTITVTIEMPDASTDIDPYVWRSDASGTEEGDPIYEANAGAGAPETINIEAEPGYYLISNSYFTALGTGYAAKGVFEPLGAAPTTPTTPTAPVANQAPLAKLGTVAKSSSAKKTRTFKGTASDADGSVAKVEVAIVKKSGSKCTQLSGKKFVAAANCLPTKFARAKGTSSWAYKPSVKLKKGSYTVYARATDDKGLVQPKFSTANRKTFRVK